MDIHLLPPLNATLNTISAALLIGGYIRIRKGDQVGHKRLMVMALATSALFLTSYLIYHQQAGSVPYPLQDWTRNLYFLILIPHIILAALMGPFIISGVVFAIRQKFDTHKRIMRWTLPVWLFVSISGVFVYLALYVYAA